MSINKIGLVMEGGAMKGLFTCGVIDVMMEEGIKMDGAIGVSAGACFGCNYKSKQPGRAVRYNKEFVKDDRYASFKNLLKEGNFYGVDFCYRTLPIELDPWDFETFSSNPMEFYVVATDCNTGRAVYHKCGGLTVEEELDWIRASASVPIVSKIVEIKDRKLLDGGIGDPIPLRYMESKGYTKNIVITTKPAGYQDQPKTKAIALEKIFLRQYPNFVKAQCNRPKHYNETLEYIRKQEESGNVLAIRPPMDLGISGRAKDEADVERVYQIGRETALGMLEEIKAFCNE